jgi:type I restriction enzyme S subunit
LRRSLRRCGNEKQGIGHFGLEVGVVLEGGGVVANRNISIGKLFNIEKGQLQSTKCTPGKYDFITAAEDWKTHNQYNYECEALIFAAAASGSLGRTHYVDGKFISSDLCFILTPKDEKKYPLNLAFYHFVFNSLRPVLVAATKSGTSKESINQSN